MLKELNSVWKAAARLADTARSRAARFFQSSGGDATGGVRGIATGEKVAENDTSKIAVKALWILSAVAMVRYAWVSDDAHIILRTIDNFYHGYGLTWNASERVQAFTCPLWTLLLSLFYFVTCEGYYTTLAVSLAVSLYTVYYVSARTARSMQGAVLATSLLLLSRAFVDYSTSGLENPLTHLLIVIYCTVAARAAADRSVSSFRLAAFIFALLVTNRMDTAVLLGPSLFYLFWIGPQRLRRAAAGLLAFAPAALWFGFSLFYYGFLLPNTAYAKLSTGISSSELLTQGLFYLRNSLFWDPISLTATAGAIGAAVYFRRPGRPLPLLLGAGMVLHLVYTVRVGGDHMSGRFLTPVFMTAAVLIAAAPFRRWRHTAVLLVLFVVLGFMGWAPTLGFSPKGQGAGLDAASIADERGFCFEHYGLFFQSRYLSLINNYLGNRGTRHLRAGAHVLADSHIGLFGYYAGPEVHLVDPLGLTDPLTARLPIPFGKHWRTGHYGRIVPPGYLEAAEGAGVIEDPDLREYYKHLKNIISGPLWRLDRFNDIIQFNLGSYDALKERYVDRSVGIMRYEDLSRYKREGRIPWNEQDNLILGAPGVGILVSPKRWRAHMSENGRFHVSLGGGYLYDVRFLENGNRIGQSVIDLRDSRKGFLAEYRMQPPPEVASRKVDLVRIRPRDTHGQYAVGDFRFEEKPEVFGIETWKARTGAYTFSDRDLEIYFPQPIHPGALRMGVPSDSAFQVEFLQANRLVWTTSALTDNWDKERIKRISIPKFVSNRGIDRIRIVPRVGGPKPMLENLEVL